MRVDAGLELGCASIDVASTDGISCSRFVALCRSLFIDSPSRPCSPTPRLKLSVESGSLSTPVATEDDPAAFRISLPGACFDIDLEAATARARIEQAFWDLDPARQREFLTTGWVTLLHAGGLFALHANAIQGPMGGVLLVGPSGAGKTTLSASLAAAGWKWIADDVVLLRSVDEDIQAFPLRRGFAWAPADAASSRRNGKQLVADLPDVGRGPSFCFLRAVVFVSVGGGAHSEVSPIDETTALSRLMEQSPTLLLHPRLAGTQLEVLGRLLRQSTWTSFRGGRDVFEEPARVACALAGVAAVEGARS
jgi:hypothetical protein